MPVLSAEATHRDLRQFLQPAMPRLRRALLQQYICEIRGSDFTGPSRRLRVRNSESTRNAPIDAYILGQLKRIGVQDDELPSAKDVISRWESILKNDLPAFTLFCYLRSLFGAAVESMFILDRAVWMVCPIHLPGVVSHKLPF